MERKMFRPRKVLDIVSHIEQVPRELLKTGKRQIRKQTPAYVKKIAKSVETFGLIGAVVINDDNEIISGHALVAACDHLGLKHVPVIRVSHLSATQQQAFALAHNKLAESGEWNFDENGLSDRNRPLRACPHLLARGNYRSNRRYRPGLPPPPPQHQRR